MQNTTGYAWRYLSASRENERLALQELLNSEALLDAISALIHALQRERGISTLWLCTDTRLTPPHLATRQHEVDEALSAMLVQLPGPEERAAAGRLYGRVALALQALSGLEALRAQVQRRQLPHAEAMQQFSELIRHLLHLIFEAADNASHSMSRALLALFSFMQGKELAGQERATGAAGFAAGAFSKADRQQLITLLECQDRSFSTFCQFADEGSLQAWRAIAEAGQETEKLRRIACSGMNPRGVNAQHWFRLISERLDGMKQIEARLRQQVMQVCRHGIAQLEAANAAPPTEACWQPLGYNLYVADAPWLEEGGALDVAGIAPQLGRSLLALIENQAQRLQAQSDELAAMHAALAERKQIDRAKALLMQHHQCDEQQAWHTLRKMAMDQNKRVGEIARAMVEVAAAFSLPQTR
ncbi:transcription antitermination regulator [Mixta theicola]|uniref:Transcription antitermination regulator n=2 Tax=Mixta theicola TaxID=1458355 RepID=A0A2K1Q5I2_9GAMM|nr:transcription antitermination regulator [Mixta theicola]